MTVCMIVTCSTLSTHITRPQSHDLPSSDVGLYVTSQIPCTVYNGEIVPSPNVKEQLQYILIWCFYVKIVILVFFVRSFSISFQHAHAAPFAVQSQILTPNIHCQPWQGIVPVNVHGQSGRMHFTSRHDKQHCTILVKRTSNVMLKTQYSCFCTVTHFICW